MSHNVLRSFMSDLLDGDSACSVSIMDDNARGPIRPRRVRRSRSDCSSSDLSSTTVSADDASIRYRRFSDNCSSSAIPSSKRYSRWEAFEEKGSLVTPKRCTSPMRLPLRSLAHHMDFGFDTSNSIIGGIKDENSKNDDQVSTGFANTLCLVDEAISVCAQVGKRDFDTSVRSCTW